MAGIPLNTFRTVVKNVQRPNQLMFGPPPTYTFTGFDPVNSYFDGIYPPAPGQNGNSSFLVYTAPLGVTAVILYAQVATDSTDTRTVSLWYYRPNQSAYPVGFNTIVNEIEIPSNDALVVIGGKLVLETGDQLYISSKTVGMVTAVAATPEKSITDTKLTLSILESANQ